MLAGYTLIVLVNHFVLTFTCVEDSTESQRVSPQQIENKFASVVVGIFSKELLFHSFLLNEADTQQRLPPQQPRQFT